MLVRVLALSGLVHSVLAAMNWSKWRSSSSVSRSDPKAGSKWRRMLISDSCAKDGPSAATRLPCSVRWRRLAPAPALHAGRKQYAGAEQAENEHAEDERAPAAVERTQGALERLRGAHRRAACRVSLNMARNITQ